MHHRFLLLSLLSLAAAEPAFALTAQPAQGKPRLNQDTYVPGKAFTPAHADTCDGDTWVNYKCPEGVVRTCTDVRFSHKTGTEADSNTTYKLCSPNCPTDTCDAYPDRAYFCGPGINKVCTDVKKMGGLRYKSTFTCQGHVFWWVDVAVTCVK